MRPAKKEVRIRLVKVFGVEAFEITAVHSKEQACFERMEDTLVAVARILTVGLPDLAKGRSAGQKKSGQTLTAFALACVRSAGEKGITSAEIASRPGIAHSTTSVAAALCDLAKKGMVERVGRQPIVWKAVANP